MKMAGNWYGESQAVMKGKIGRTLRVKQTNAAIQIF
jgi:hypothetical protein